MKSYMASTLTIAEALKQSVALQEVSDSARIDVEVFLAAVLQKDRSYLYTWPEKTLTDAQQIQFMDNLARRTRGEPVAYILGEKEFWSLTLAVDPSTLIPRPDTEILVETALTLFAHDDVSDCRRVIDLGTGTGAIALALASEKPQWQLIAADNNPQACRLAESNRKAHGYEHVSVVCSDWLSAIDEPNIDMIVTNPPYIDEDDPHLMQGDVRFEPLSALGAHNKGLADIEIIAGQAARVLLPNGYFCIEQGYQQAEQVTAVLQACQYHHCFTVNDMSGHPRITIGQTPCE
jgi:release factor glutamine methyltransferase